jgi:N-methylhydantoinase A
MRVAIDTGGTFTDILLFDEEKNKLWPLKIPTNPEHPEKAFLQGLLEVLEFSKSDPANIETIIHGTTLVTNALLQQQTAKTGLLVTAGFRDLLEIGRQDRAELYNLQLEKRPPLVPRELIREIPERIGPEGQILKKLDLQAARRALYYLHQEGVESLAISLLFSFLNSSHEKQLGQLASDFFPEEFIFLSSQLSPEFREYERTSTTVVAAAVAPRVVNYLQVLLNNLDQIGCAQSEVFIMHSGGGMLPAREAAHHPHQLIESGPAAGLMAAAHLSQLLHLPRVIAFDMGGTTAKAGVIFNGQPQYTVDYQVGGDIHRGGRNYGGYPVRFPMIDVTECGAGSGSIAWIDPGGHLQVGPRSAGAHPGPAGYGQGGKEPTVTDAYLLLGFLQADDLLGGRKALFPALARKAIQEEIAQPLGLEVRQAAQGILTLVNANMLRILRLVSISRGHDPRDFTLLPYGGAGPLHACHLAEEMEIKKIIIPPFPGLFSATGLLLSDITMDFVRTKLLLLSENNITTIQAIFSLLLKEAEAWFQRTGLGQDKTALFPSVDLRYQGQNYELNVPFSGKKFTRDLMASLLLSFHQIHQQLYGHCEPRAPVELVNLRLKAVVKVTKPQFPPLEKATTSIQESRESFREIWLAENIKKGIRVIKCPVFQRDNLRAGHEIKGPALIKETCSTTFVGPGWHLQVDTLGNLILER